MNIKLKFIICLVGSAVTGTVLYIILHEAGHSLIALACGAEITRFSIVNASMSYTGGSFGAISGPLLHAAGLLLPLVIACMLLLFYSRRIKSMLYHSFCYILALISVGSAFAWVLVPVIALMSVPPAGDDVTMFLEVSGLPPIIVMLCALLIILLMVLLMVKKGLFAAFLRIIRDMRAQKS